MEYKLTRYEKRRDHDGNVTGIFINVELLENSEIFNRGHWLTSEESTAVLSDETALQNIIENVAAEGHVAFNLHVATKPMPIIIEDVSRFTINARNVVTKVRALR